MVASDGTNTATAGVTININDVNDNPIKCDPMWVYVTVDEDIAGSEFWIWILFLYCLALDVEYLVSRVGFGGSI